MIDITKQLNNEKDIIVRSVRERTRSIIAYRIILTALLREINREVRRSVIPAYKADLQYSADAASWFTSLKAVATSAVSTAVSKAKDLFSGESTSHLKRFNASIRTATGIDIAALIDPVSSSDLMQTVVEQNTSLITSLSDDAVKRVEQAVYRAKLQKQSAAELSKEIQKQLNIVKSRADLIAVDQIASINADLNEARQKAIGINSYAWSGKLDARERKLHRGLEGKIYKWGESTGAEGGLPPGKPIRCRCVARAVIPKRDIVKRVRLKVATTFGR